MELFPLSARTCVFSIGLFLKKSSRALIQIYDGRCCRCLRPVVIYALPVELCLSVICQGWRTYNLRRCTIFGSFYSASPPPVAPGNTKAMCRVVLCRLHKDARCLVCLHLVTARSISQQPHVLGAPVLLVFTLTPLPPLACHHPPSLSLNSATQEQSPVACSASVNVPAAVFFCLQ